MKSTAVKPWKQSTINKAAKAADDDEQDSDDSPTSQEAKKRKEPDGPKKPQTAYFLFMAEQRALPAMQEVPGGERMGVLGKMWGELTDEGKIKYQQMAIEDKERYGRECKEVRAHTNTCRLQQQRVAVDSATARWQAGIETPEEKKARLVVEKAAAKASDSAAKEAAAGPKKPQTAYFLFMAEQRALPAMQEVPGGERMGLLGKMWGELTDEGKVKYQQMATEDKERYACECKEVRAHVSAQMSCES